MKAARLLRLYNGLIVVMAIGWLVNLYLEMRHAHIDPLRAAALPLLVVIATTILLRGAVRSRPVDVAPPSST